ncbi:MAG TPA: PQQ-binding-like beta-propeller repeat protein [Vicinamibacterales bacterium]|nr:PQQ-binding-like beta-propeller repeat protein [Vicinamibacterales bacterium]
MLLALALLAFAGPDGAKVFEEKCSGCHKPGSETRAPLPAVLKEMARAAIVKSLESGSMKAQGAALTADERLAVAMFLSAKIDAPAALANTCPMPMPALSKLTGWNGWSASAGNTRYVARTVDPAKLKLKWAFGHPGSVTAVSQPTVVDSVLFMGSEKGIVYALDAATGCEFWRYQAEAGVRVSILVHDGAALFGDTKANVYSIDAQTAALKWKLNLDKHPFARITGTPSLHEDRLYVPVSSAEEVPAGNPKYPCCTFRGSVAAINSGDGKLLWQTYMIPDEPKPTTKNSAGTQRMGPAGAAVWLSPTIDPKRKMLYVGTGNGYGEPETPFTDAVVALDLATGARKWHKQLTPNDRWNLACVGQFTANCPPNAGEDFDFGASPLLVKGADGKDRILAGQKSAIVHALDPDAEGAILWQTRVGQGGALGGVEFGMAADARAVYVPLSDFNGRDAMAGGGLFALQITTGEKLWHTPPPPPPCKSMRPCSAAQMAPATALQNVIFSGSMDGTLRGYDSATGKIVWEFPTLTEFETVNQVKAKGGSLNSTGAVIVGKMLYVQSGYGALGGIPGNVLLAFELQ